MSSTPLSTGPAGRVREKKTYLGYGHGDVEELPSPSLRDGPGEEQLQPVLGKQGFLVLNTHTYMTYTHLSTLEYRSLKRHSFGNWKGDYKHSG